MIFASRKHSGLIQANIKWLVFLACPKWSNFLQYYSSKDSVFFSLSPLLLYRAQPLHLDITGKYLKDCHSNFCLGWNAFFVQCHSCLNAFALSPSLSMLKPTKLKPPPSLFILNFSSFPVFQSCFSWCSKQVLLLPSSGFIFRIKILIECS